MSSSVSNRWRYHAAMRRKEKKVRDFAKMYGPEDPPSWAGTPTGRVTMNSGRHPSPAWQGLFKTDKVFDSPTDAMPFGTVLADYSAIEERILAAMSMSRDRVRFTIQPYGADTATAAAFCKAFGRSFPGAPMGQTVTVVCRPSQFARFLIYRNDNGGRNLFKELGPTLFTPQPKIDEIDVSGNPAS